MSFTYLGVLFLGTMGVISLILFIVFLLTDKQLVSAKGLSVKYLLLDGVLLITSLACFIIMALLILNIQAQIEVFS